MDIETFLGITEKLAGLKWDVPIEDNIGINMKIASFKLLAQIMGIIGDHYDKEIALEALEGCIAVISGLDEVKTVTDEPS